MTAIFTFDSFREGTAFPGRRRPRRPTYAALFSALQGEGVEDLLKLIVQSLEAALGGAGGGDADLDVSSAADQPHQKRPVLAGELQVHDHLEPLAARFRLQRLRRANVGFADAAGFLAGEQLDQVTLREAPAGIVAN